MKLEEHWLPIRLLYRFLCFIGLHVLIEIRAKGKNDLFYRYFYKKCQFCAYSKTFTKGDSY